MALKITVKVLRASTMCQVAYTPSLNNYHPARSISLYKQENRFKEACDLLKTTSYQSPQSSI